MKSFQIRSLLLQENMNIHRLGVDSFEMDAEDHTFSIDRCLSLFTVKLVGNGCSNIRLLRPDGMKDKTTCENLCPNVSFLALSHSYKM